MLLCLKLFQKSLRLFSIIFFLFPLFCSSAIIPTFLSSSWLIHSSASVNLLLVPYTVYVISVIVLFISAYFFFISYMFLVIILILLIAICIFSILFLRFWIIFTNITLNYFWSRYPISTSLSFSGVLSCSFVWNVFLCHLICLSVLAVPKPAELYFLWFWVSAPSG